MSKLDKNNFFRNINLLNFKIKKRCWKNFTVNLGGNFTWFKYSKSKRRK